MNLKPKISILIPAYNEAENIPILVNNIINEFKKTEYANTFEIIVINDCSKDDTESIVKNLIQKIENLKLINMKINSGKAYCLDIGINNARGEIISTIDADNQYDPKDLINMLNIINKGIDLVNGRRLSRKDNNLTLIFSKLYNFFIRNIFRIEMYDFFSGIKIYKKEIYQIMDFSGLPRFIVFFSKKYSFKIKEIKVSHYYRQKGRSSYNLLDKIILSFQDIFSLIFCIYLDFRGVYIIKQIVLIIHVLLFVVILIYSLYFKFFPTFFFYILLVSFIIFVILYLIVNSFLNSKMKKDLNLIKNIHVNENHK